MNHREPWHPLQVVAEIAEDEAAKLEREAQELRAFAQRLRESLTPSDSDRHTPTKRAR